MARNLSEGGTFEDEDVARSGIGNSSWVFRMSDKGRDSQSPEFMCDLTRCGDPAVSLLVYRGGSSTRPATSMHGHVKRWRSQGF